MRLIVKCLFVFLVLLGQTSKAAFLPNSQSPVFTHPDSIIKKSIILTPSVYGPQKKEGFIKRFQTRILQKRLKHLASFHDSTASGKNRLSTLSLILGIIGVVALFIPTVGFLGIIAGLAALTIGIIALGKSYNNSKASRTKAIIGIVLGSVIVFLTMVGLILLIAFFAGPDWQ